MPTPNPHHHHHHHHDLHNPSPPPPPKPNPKLLSLLKFIIMALILSLFLLFLGVAAIALIHILLAGSFLHRRRSRLSSILPPSTSTSAYSLDDLQKHLPPFKYPSPNFRTANNNKDCSICLDYFKEGELCRTLPVCQHVFHVNCVDQWLTKVPNCPICRNKVRLDTGSIISDDEDCRFFWATGVGRRW